MSQGPDFSVQIRIPEQSNNDNRLPQRRVGYYDQTSLLPPIDPIVKITILKSDIHFHVKVSHQKSDGQFEVFDSGNTSNNFEFFILYEVSRVQPLKIECQASHGKQGSYIKELTIHQLLSNHSFVAIPDVLNSDFDQNLTFNQHTFQIEREEIQRPPFLHESDKFPLEYWKIGVKLTFTNITQDFDLKCEFMAKIDNTHQVSQKSTEKRLTKALTKTQSFDIYISPLHIKQHQRKDFLKLDITREIRSKTTEVWAKSFGFDDSSIDYFKNTAKRTAQHLRTHSPTWVHQTEINNYCIISIELIFLFNNEMGTFIDTKYFTDNDLVTCSWIKELHMPQMRFNIHPIIDFTAANGINSSLSYHANPAERREINRYLPVLDHIWTLFGFSYRSDSTDDVFFGYGALFDIDGLVEYAHIHHGTGNISMKYQDLIATYIKPAGPAKMLESMKQLHEIIKSINKVHIIPIINTGTIWGVDDTFNFLEELQDFSYIFLFVNIHGQESAEYSAFRSKVLLSPKITVGTLFVNGLDFAKDFHRQFHRGNINFTGIPSKRYIMKKPLTNK